MQVRLLFSLALAPAALPLQDSTPQSRPASTQQIRGQVLDEHGAPAPGAKVHLSRSPFETLPPSMRRLLPDRPAEVAAVIADRDGNFRVPAEEGRSYSLHATRGESEMSPPWTVLVAGDWVSLRLRPVWAIEGRVFGDAGKWIAVADADVVTSIAASSPRSLLARFVQMSGDSSRLLLSTRTGTDGAYRLLVPAPAPGSKVHVTATKGNARTVTIEVSSSGDKHDLVLPAAVGRHAILVDKETGEPIVGVRIGREWLGDDVLSDAEGRFAVETPKECLLQMAGRSHDRLVLNSKELALTGEPAGKIALSNGPRITGRLLRRDGTPLAGALMKLSGPAKGRNMVWPIYDWTDRVGPNGEISLACVPDQSFMGWVDVDGVFVAFVATVVKGDLDLGELRLPTDGRIEGRIVATDGSPVTEGAVLVQETAGRAQVGENAPHRIVFADRTGRFVVTGLVPGSYGLTAAAVGYRLSRSNAETGASKPIVLTLPGGESIAGCVLDDAGRPVAGARITATRYVAGEGTAFGIASWYAESDAKGRFAVRGLQDGANFRIEVHAERDGKTLRGSVEVVSPGDSEVDVVVTLP